MTSKASFYTKMFSAPIIFALALVIFPCSVFASTALTTSPTDVATSAPPTGNDATSAASPEATTSSAEGSCIESSLPDVMGLSQCLGKSLDLCIDNNTARDGIRTLINCTVVSISRNLSPMNALNIMRTFFYAITNKISPILGRALDTFFGRLRTSEAAAMRDNICRGTIKVRFPNSLGKCLGNTLKLCENGTVVDMSYAQSLVTTNVCLMTEWLNSTPLDNTKRFICDILRGTKVLFDGVPFLGRATYDILNRATCR